jgi:hypothetical protein
MQTNANAQLRDMAEAWEVDGDLMRCRECRRALIASRDGEPLRHVVNCDFAGREHPWKELRAIIAPMKE